MPKKLPWLFSVTVCVCILLGAWTMPSTNMSLLIDRDNVAIILIDVQPFFVDIMSGSREPVMERLEQLLLLAEWTKIPFIATFEHPTEQN